MRRFFSFLTVFLGICFAGCGDLLPPPQLARESAGPADEARRQPPAAAVAADDTIKIASFNIQVFGTSKMGKPEVMAVLSDVARRFDVLAIQEVRSVDQTIVPRFVEMINAGGCRYDYVLGPRLGRTSSKEQYVFLYDTQRIELAPESVCTVNDPQDLLHREPLVARFRVRGPPAEQAFTFILVNIHTDPDETDTELDALADVFTAVQRAGGEDDVILLGDLNVDEYHLGRLGQLPGITYAITGTTTNTRRNKMYDNLVFDARTTTEYTKQWGVLDLMAEYGLSEEAALEVSDHLPVWAAWSVYEAGTGVRVATESQPAVR